MASCVEWCGGRPTHVKRGGAGCRAVPALVAASPSLASLVCPNCLAVGMSGVGGASSSDGPCSGS
eukprot:4966811-Alexandrium_andersonii.AAC.1